MYALERLPGEGDLVHDAPDMVPVAPEGTILVGQRRPYHEDAGALVVSLNDSTVTSGRHGHCRLWPAEGSVLIADCGSDNGTWLLDGDAPRAAGTLMAPTRIEVGQIVCVGRSRFRLAMVADRDGTANHEAGVDSPRKTVR